MKISAAILGMCGLLLAAGCGSSSSSGSSSGLTAADAAGFLGIYQMTSYGANMTACDPAGVSSLDARGNGYFLITDETLFGRYLVTIVSCSSVSDCQAKRPEVTSGDFYTNDYPFTLNGAANATTLTGVAADSGAPNGSMCTGRSFSDYSLVMDADHSVHFESRTKNLADKPNQGDYCAVLVADAEREAASQPCATLTVLDGTFVQAM
jgi:hypothetical protein